MPGFSRELTPFFGLIWQFDPIVQTALESPESLETTGVAGRCEPGWGMVLTPAFSPA